MTRHELKERPWLESEALAASRLSDPDRVRILRDLWRTIEAIRRTKTAAELEREDEVRRTVDEPGRQRYRRLVQRLG